MRHLLNFACDCFRHCRDLQLREQFSFMRIIGKLLSVFQRLSLKWAAELASLAHCWARSAGNQSMNLRFLTEVWWRNHFQKKQFCENFSQFSLNVFKFTNKNSSRIDYVAQQSENLRLQAENFFHSSASPSTKKNLSNHRKIFLAKTFHAHRVLQVETEWESSPRRKCWFLLIFPSRIDKCMNIHQWKAIRRDFLRCILKQLRKETIEILLGFFPFQRRIPASTQ